MENIPWHQSPLAFREPILLMHDQGGLLTSGKETCGLGRAQPPPLKVLLFCLFDPQGMNLQLLYPRAGRWRASCPVTGSGLPSYSSRRTLRIKMLGASPMAQVVKNLPAIQETQETWVPYLGQQDPLEEEMVTHSSILA